MTVNQWATQGEASADINRQIVDKFGSDPAVLAGKVSMHINVDT